VGQGDPSGQHQAGIIVRPAALIKRVPMKAPILLLMR
jgi:hypothetical protein